MPPLADSLATRIIAVVLAGIVALQLALATIVLAPAGLLLPGGGRPQAPAYPPPDQALAIVAALEEAPLAARPAVLRALNTSTVAVWLDEGFPALEGGAWRPTAEHPLARGYAQRLPGREIQVVFRPAGVAESRRIQLLGGRQPAVVRVSLRLRDGLVLSIERTLPGEVRRILGRTALFGAMAGLLIIGGLALAVTRTARPVTRLASAARRIGASLDEPDLPVKGPRELRDLATAFNEMKEQIRELLNDRTRVLAAVAHDYRTYLTRLRLQAEYVGDEDLRRSMVADLEDMSALLDDTLLFASQAARVASAPAAFDPAAEAAAFAGELQGTRAGVRLMAEPGLTMVGSRMAFRRILANLTQNALRYGGDAEIRIARDGASLRLSILDRGPGIPEDALERVLLPFERLEASRGRGTGGAGLGLPIVKALAESQGGTLDLSNRAGGGLRAVVRLPLTRTEPRP